MSSQVKIGAFIYKIGHIDNLPLYAKYGLCSPNFAGKTATSDAEKFKNIYDLQIQSDRGNKPIPIRHGRTLHDYVPFYFCYKTPMQYRVQLTQKAEDILIFVVEPAKIEKLGKDFVFTDMNAWEKAANWWENLNDINADNLNYEAINAVYWNDNNFQDKNFIKVRKQAEFLIYERLELQDITGIAVYNKQAQNKVKTLLESKNITIPVAVKSDWYF